MSSAIVAIELLSDRMDVAVVGRGKVHARKRVRIELPDDPTSWARTVRAGGELLRTAVQELGVPGRPAVVLFRSPTLVADTCSFRIRSAGQAREAAILNCTETLSYSVGSAISEAVVLGRDRSGADRQTHVVVAAERSDIVRAIEELVRSAGLVFESATPMEAAIMAGVVQRALRFGGARHGWLHLGEHSSFFVLGGQGRITFERSISIGLETIIAAMTRSIRLRGGDDTVTLEAETARRILADHGIPNEEVVFQEEPRLTRRHIMPLIQPVLQRLIVELRQSLRFGLPEADRDSISITVQGPGAAVPGLPELIGGELRLEVSADQHDKDFDYRMPAGPGSELLEMIENRAFLRTFNLQPPDLAQRRLSGTMRRWLWTGGAAALIVVGAYGQLVRWKIRQAADEVGRLSSATAVFTDAEKSRQRVISAIQSLNRLEKQIDEEIGAPLNLRAVFQELSLITPASIELVSMQFRREGTTLTCRIDGQAAPVEPPSARTELEPFIEALKRSPLLDDVILRNVEVSGLGLLSGQRFDARFDVVPCPEPRRALADPGAAP